MFLDLIFVVLLVLAIIKGYQRGLIVGVFSFISIVVGLAAAIKLSAVVAGYLGRAVDVSDQWLPILSFAVVFIIVILLVRWGANLIQRTVEAVALGWLNRLGGIIFYAGIFIITLSVLIFYAEQVHLLGPRTIGGSRTYPYVQPWGPKVIDSLGSIIPLFKNMFLQLQNFFSGLSGKLSS